MKTTQKLKEIYEANPDEWIALWSTPIGWQNHGVWFKTSNPNFVEEYHYKLIHIRHKAILDAYLADSSAMIEVRYHDSSTMQWYNAKGNFVENYNPDLEYRLKERRVELIEDLGMLYPNTESKDKRRYGLYKCYCGTEFKVQTQTIKRGSTTSCGCHRASLLKTHGLKDHPLYSTWNGMIGRTSRPNDSYYDSYGGRGIAVCERWKTIENFIEDMYPTYKEGLTIDRIDNDGNYEPSNCRWAEKTTQARNTRRIQSNNKTGYRGVSYRKATDKYIAQIIVDYKNIYIGSFKTALDAGIAYDEYVIGNNLEHTRNF